MKTMEWTDARGQRNVFVADAGLTFPVAPLPERHAYDPMIRRFMGHPEMRGPECLGCLPYRFAEDHPIHQSVPIIAK